MDENLQYHDADGISHQLKGCTLTIDKSDRYWLWSEQLQHNLAHNIKGREDCLIAAIDSLLFTIELQNERIAKLQSVVDLASAFADAVNDYNEK